MNLEIVYLKKSILYAQLSLSMVAPGQPRMEAAATRLTAPRESPRYRGEQQPGYCRRAGVQSVSLCSTTFSSWDPDQITASQDASFYLWNVG